MRLPRWILITAALTSTSLWATACAEPERSHRAATSATIDVAAVSPALADYRDRIVEGELWQRAGLSPRDRSVVTVAALIARDQAVDMPAQFARALDNGVTPAEMSETITHLAFYAGWPNAMSAVAAAERLFAAPATSRTTGRSRRASWSTPPTSSSPTCGCAQPWRPGTGVWSPSARSSPPARPNNSPSTSTAPWTTGSPREQASEALTQLAFYAGWPSVFSALPVVKDVFAGRPS